MILIKTQSYTQTCFFNLIEVYYKIDLNCFHKKSFELFQDYKIMGEACVKGQLKLGYLDKHM